jgi:dTDP-glucose 4,6-dehydratase
MRILITGLCGFIAHHVADVLLEETDHEIVGIDRIDATSTVHRLRYVNGWESKSKRVKFVWHDLRAPINELVSRQIGHVDVILHLAASTHVDRSIEDPMLFVMDNVVGTCNVLDYARKIRPQFVVNFSTDEVFGPAPVGTEYKEWDRFRSGNPYAATKAGAEQLACSYANTYDMPILTTFMMNVFGERQHAEKFVPKTISRVLSGKTLPIHTDKSGKSGSRFYIYARNAGYVIKFLIDNHAAHPSLYGDRLNLVGGREIENLELARMIAEIVGKPLNYELVAFRAARPGNDFRYALDEAKLGSLGFQYQWSLHTSLERTVRWFMENSEWLE